MHKILSLFFTLVVFIACKEQRTSEIPSQSSTNLRLDYAKSFEIQHYETHKTLIIKNPWPGAEKTFTYALVPKGSDFKSNENFDAIVEVPIDKIVVTSTTHIPSLEMLDGIDALAGFPNLQYISSEKTRNLIDNGKIKELGKNEDLNTEVLIDLQPEAVITFAVEGGNKTVSTIEKTGIPVLYNADWTETTPLGKAEWIKYFGVLMNKEEKADSIFSEIESNYNEAKKIAAMATQKPTVLSGAMYKDVWYLPQGDSWAAQFIKDANGEYLWAETVGTGSLSLNLESVLEKGQAAQYWIGPGQFTSLDQMKEAHLVYEEFDAFKNESVYSFTTNKGATGGVIYYELAPNRPDIVLKDIIKVLHPELLPDHQPFFFSKIE